MKDWKETCKKIEKAAQAIRYEPSRDIVKTIKYANIETGAGNGGAFNAWVFSCGDVRHVGAYCYYILWFAKHSDDFTLSQLKDMLRLWPRQPAEFAAYCGFVELWDFIQEVGEALESIESKEDLISLVNALWEYANQVNAWIYQYIPWGVFTITPTMSKDFYRDSANFLGN